MTYFGVAPTPPRIWELWSALPARLDTPRMQAILGAASRVKLETDDLSSLGETTVWGRLVIVPVRRLYGELADEPGRRRVVPFLVRSEVHAVGSDYQPAIPLEAAQEETFLRLHGWTPAGFTRARAAAPLERVTPPQALPLWDDSSGLWFLTSEYRAVLAPA